MENRENEPIELPPSSPSEALAELLKEIVSAEKGIGIGPYRPLTLFFSSDEAANAFLAALASLPQKEPPVIGATRFLSCGCRVRTLYCHSHTEPS